MVSLMNAHIKRGDIRCEIPVNKVSFNLLRLLRDSGLIYGFSHGTPGIRHNRLYPRAIIFFKYAEYNTPLLKGLRVFKRTKSNFYDLRHNKLYSILLKNKLYILSTPQGLTITSLNNLYQNRMLSRNVLKNGKLLAEIFV